MDYEVKFIKKGKKEWTFEQLIPPWQNDLKAISCAQYVLHESIKYGAQQVTLSNNGPSGRSDCGMWAKRLMSTRL